MAQKKFHDSMNYMEKHGLKRSCPDQLLPGTIRVISLKIHYFSRDAKKAQNLLESDGIGYISSYALGFDYHETIRNKLKILIGKIREFLKITRAELLCRHCTGSGKSIGKECRFGLDRKKHKPD